MDDYKKKLHKNICGISMWCDCCNQYFGKSKKILNRIARRTLKQDDIKNSKSDIYYD